MCVRVKKNDKVDRKVLKGFGDVNIRVNKEHKTKTV